MRSTIILSGVLALALLAEPVKADSTSNTVFLVVNWDGGFATGNNEESYEYSSYQSEGTLLMFNLASVGGTFPFITLSFPGIEGEFDLSELEYFIIGGKIDSEHLILSGDGEGDGFHIDDDEEHEIFDNLANLGGDLATPGGSMFLTPDQFGTMVAPIDMFTGPDALFDMTANIGEGMDVIGFSDGEIVGFLVVNADGTATFVPEPGLTVLALVGIAGTVIARRRRRKAAA